MDIAIMEPMVPEEASRDLEDGHHRMHVETTAVVETQRLSCPGDIV